MKSLGIDLGSKTIGLAIGQGVIAQPWQTLKFEEHNYDGAINILLPIIYQYQPNEIVVGYPINMNGTIGKSAEQVVTFKNMLDMALQKKIAIVLVDERWSTISAQKVLIMADLSRKKQKKVKDQTAATIILQTHFDTIKNRKYSHDQ